MSSSPLSSQLTSQAITAALTSNWEEALRLNQEIVSTEPENVDALNRLARAYFELGDLNLSRKNYENALKIDPYNQIAFKFLKRIEACAKSKNGNGKIHAAAPITLSADMFIEEPGKTKLVNLIKVAEPQKLSALSAGQPVNLVPRNRGISVTDTSSAYLGALPDDVSHRLLRLINGGNKYQSFIKNIKPNSIAILIKEIHRSARFKNQPSFLENITGALAYSSDHIIISDDNEDMVEESEEEVN